MKKLLMIALVMALAVAAAPAAGARSLAEERQTRWWCCFTDADCLPYGGTRCIGGSVCGVCLP